MIVNCFIPSSIWFCFPEWVSLSSRTYINGVNFIPVLDWF